MQLEQDLSEIVVYSLCELRGDTQVLGLGKLFLKLQKIDITLIGGEHSEVTGLRQYKGSFLADNLDHLDHLQFGGLGDELLAIGDVATIHVIADSRNGRELHLVSTGAPIKKI